MKIKKLTIMLLSVIIFFAFINPVEAQQPRTYTVQPGDSMWRIAVKYQIGVSEIIKANPQIANPNLIYPKQTLQIPNIEAIKTIEKQVITLVNQERAKAGLGPLKANWELSRVARHKSMDMRDRGYFSHTSPTYGSPSNMIRAYGLSFSYAGENIAAGQATAAQVMKGWMESTGHRQNILNRNYTQIGVGYAKGGKMGHYWTQMFVR